MSVLRKIIKNVTGSTKTIVGVEISNNSQIEIPVSQWAKLADQASSYDSLIDAGTIVVNDGSSDLTAVNGKLWIRLLADDKASTHSFSNATNGFSATNVQTAIEEARTSAEGLPRSTLILTNNGTVGASAWINYSELLSNPRIVFPIRTQIKEITWNNSSSNLGAFTFEIYKNGQVSPTNRIYIYTPTAGQRTAGFGYGSITSDLIFEAGDVLYLKHIRTSGTALADLALVLWTVRLA